MRVVLVPPVPALLPAYSSLIDPVAELRAACLAAVSWLVAPSPAEVTVVYDGTTADDVRRGVTEPIGGRVATWLLAEAGFAGALSPGAPPPPPAEAVLVVANGSARRGERAPGHLDERARGFDDAVEAALRSGDPDLLAGLDEQLGAQLLAAGVGGLRALGGVVGGVRAEVDYADDPFGVQYWVMRWER